MNTTVQAMLWMTGAIFSFSVMAVAGREASVELDTFEIMLYRSLLGVVVVIIVAGALGRLGEVKFDRLALHGARNLAHFTGQNLWFFAVATGIPLAQIFAIEFTSPLWTILLTPLLLREKLTPVNMVAGIVGFIGILIVAPPVAASVNAGTITAALAAICFALTAIATRKLTSDQSIVCILFWLTVMQAVFGVIAAGYDGSIGLPSSKTVWYLLAIGLCGLFAHLCLTTALSLAPPPVVMPLDFLRLPLISLVGYLLYQEPIEIAVYIGAALIFMANYANIVEAQRREDSPRVNKATSN